MKPEQHSQHRVEGKENLKTTNTTELEKRISEKTSATVRLVDKSQCLLFWKETGDLICL